MAKKNLMFGLAAVFIVTVGAMAAAIPEEIVRLIPASAALFAAASKDAEKPAVKSAASNEAAVAGKPISSLSDSGELNDSTVQTPKIPIQITYLFLFKRVIALDKKASEAESKRKDGSDYRHHFRDKAKITEEQNAALFKISKDCFAEVSKKDDKAKRIIDDARAKYPEGKVKKGDSLPPPPAELAVLQQERDAIILEYINRLRESFGAADFAKFQQFLDRDITSRITTDLTDKTRPEAPTGESRSPMLPETSNDLRIKQ